MLVENASEYLKKFKEFKTAELKTNKTGKFGEEIDVVYLSLKRVFRAYEEKVDEIELGQGSKKRRSQKDRKSGNKLKKESVGEFNLLEFDAPLVVKKNGLGDIKVEKDGGLLELDFAPVLVIEDQKKESIENKENLGKKEFDFFDRIAIKQDFF